MSALWTAKEAADATHGTTAGDWTATGISIDTRSLERGDLFVALKGDARDGHEFVVAALAKGAAAALVSHRPDTAAADAPLLIVKDTQVGLEGLGRASRARSHAKIVAVTGSAGKTTTKELLRLVLSGAGAVSASTASYNNHWGVPLSLARMPRDADFGVFEIGMNHAGEIRALVAQVRPHVAIVTTIAPAHLEHFGTVEAIADAKSEIFEGIEKGGPAIIPADNPMSGRLAAHAREAGVARILTFGMQAGADARLVTSETHGDVQDVVAELHGKPIRFRLGAAGNHIATNALAAFLAATELGVGAMAAAGSLTPFTSLKGRGARVHACGVEVIDESYNANPASMAAALGLLGAAQPSARGRRIAVLGDMLELGPQAPALHRAIAADIETARADLVFLCGPNMESLWDVLPQSRRGAYATTSSGLTEPLAAALHEGDVILVKGSNGSRMSVIIDALRARGPRAAAWGLAMFHYFLVPLADKYYGLNLFRYLTFRAGCAVMTALVISFVIGPPLIRWLKLKQGKGQPIRADGPQRHVIEKQGTPTMGGFMILLSVTISTLLWGDLANGYVWTVLLVTLAYGVLGFIDDYQKVTKRTSAGVSGKFKLLFQVLIAVAACICIARLQVPALANHLAVPFFKDTLWNMGWFYVAFGAIVIVGASNAVNLTDGLDGLAIVPVMIAAATFLLIAYLVGNFKFSEYLVLHYVAGTGELIVLLGAVVGASLGFLWYNAPPAAVFMGDTGSLSLGGLLGTTAVAIKHEIVLAIVGGLFVLEALSVIIQVASFKMTGKRVFRMAPIHHHYEQLGWKKSTVVIRFWIIAVVLALLGLATLKLR